MALAGVGPAAGDVFGEFRRQVENLTPSYCDLGRLAHYRVRIPTLSGVGKPFELALAEEQQIEP